MRDRVEDAIGLALIVALIGFVWWQTTIPADALRYLPDTVEVSQ